MLTPEERRTMQAANDLAAERNAALARAEQAEAKASLLTAALREIVDEIRGAEQFITTIPQGELRQVAHSTLDAVSEAADQARSALADSPEER